MTVVMNFERTPQAEEQARDWVVRIDAGPLSADERQLLQQWLAQDASHPRLLDEHALLWATASRARFPAAAAHAAPAGTAWQGPVLRRSGWAWALGSLGSLGSAVLVATLWLNGSLQPSATDLTLAALHVTAIGKPEPVALPDGSRTELNAASSLRVAYSPERRRVLLERGEGLFDVAKDKTRPFEVVAGDTVVRAVGTRFLVQRHGDGRVEVTVYEGVVEVTKPVAASAEIADAKDAQASPQPLRLGMGQTAVSAAQHTLVALAEPQAMGRKLAWQQGRIEFDRTPLLDALEEVNRYSSLPIRMNDASLQTMLVSGSFSTRDTAVFLRSLEQGFGLRVQRAGDAWVLSRADVR
nr:FecR domain-containing protein [uncultured Roseateles sp.]